MSIEVRKSDDVCILDVSGKLVLGTDVAELRQKSKELIASGGRRFVLSLEHVSFMDSAAIGETMACGKRARENGGDLRIILVPGGKPEQLLKLTRLDQIFETFENEQAALASFGEAG